VRLVVDASVALKWVLGSDRPEANREQAAALLQAIADARVSAIQPVHWIAEVMAVVARMDPPRIDPTLAFLDAVPFKTADSPVLYQSAARLSADRSQHLFDTLYHAVAIEHDAMLVTADERYYAAARNLGHIVHIRDLALPAASP